jgi:hypothetical protein
MEREVIDAVLSYHANPNTCGVTKFNIQLAEKLGVPHDVIAPSAPQRRYPLLSVKWNEILGPHDGVSFDLNASYGFDLLLHDRSIKEDCGLIRAARRVFYADEIGCPSTLRGDATRKGLTILSFGMAHKFQAPLFAKLKALLDDRGQDYTICVSSAIHEGSPWDATTKAHTDQLREVFGDHLRWLGFLADDALAREIREAHMIALFYDPAVRANNTTLWAALEAGTPVITNLDAQSPPELVHDVSVFDLAQLTDWPEAHQLREVRHGGTQAASVYSWDRLVLRLTENVQV